MTRNNNWADILNRQVGYVVLRKGNRLQVIHRPSAKQLRERGKRHWVLVAALDASPGRLPAEVRDAVLKTLSELVEDKVVVDDNGLADGKKTKKKSRL